MIFKPYLIDKIVSSDKTQTRRPAKRTEAIYRLNGRSSADSIIYVSNGRPKWEVGRDYAVQPGRGQSGVWWNPQTKEWFRVRPLELRDELKVLRIRILEIGSEDVRDISHADAIAEGFNTELEPKSKFLEIWCGFYDPIMLVTPPMKDGKMVRPNHTAILSDRPHEKYQAWVLKFEID